MQKQTLSPLFYKLKPQVWGLKKPETAEEMETYHKELVGALMDLSKLNFKYYIVNSYNKMVLVIKNAPEVSV